ncbi:MAG: Gfo/Idh/MocA family oxidoreductase [Chloroflexi bacterium]|nr:Gfo/Idh/MocA family oxidoreductase [Chloroflexota bacterium]
MGIRVGICGTGAFADSFIPLFTAHPAVEQVVLSDLDAEKLSAKSAKFGLPETCASLDDLCAMDLDAIAIFTQHHIHCPQAVQALRSGKHVYSAVPSAITMEEIADLVKTVEETGLIYMVGETSYYYPCAIYCRGRFRNGDFGRVVYAEAEYYHDFDHGLYDVYRWRHGDDWERYAGLPPMFYPTHSVSMVVSVTGAHVTQVSCFGFVDNDEDMLFDPERNVWNNPYSNQTALCRLSDGSTARFNEFRRIGHPGTVGMSLYGTEGSYEEQVKGQMWVTKDLKTCIDLTEELAPIGLPVGGVDGQMAKVTGADGTHVGVSRVHEVSRLPKEYIGLPNGHNGSHQFLIDDFVTACVTGQTPSNNVWDAARYLAPGLIAHESCKRDGELLDVPDYGDAPASP